jgi:serine/threonine protein kinase
VLAGRYRIVATIGVGGMGVAYRAWDAVADRYCVVKTPRRDLLSAPQFVERFARELAVLQHLRHPAIVPIDGVGEEEGIPYAVMPYLAGGSLKRRQRVRQGRPIPAEAASVGGWLVPVAGAIDFVHASGLVHRDVKPDNILFDGAGNPFLGDFGVAKVVIQAESEHQSTGLTATGIALGTPAYMAPELIDGSEASAASDQYALAVMTYELLAGRKPFDGPTPAAIIVAHAAGSPVPLASLRADLPASVAAAVMRGLSKDPAKRFKSCGSFAEAVLASLPRQAEVEKQQLMCPRCGRLLNVQKAWAGRRGSCPKCEGALSISSDALTLWLPEDRSGPIALVSHDFEIGQLGHTPSDGLELPKTLSQQIWQSLRQSVVCQALLAAVMMLALIVGAALLSQKSEPQAVPADAMNESRNERARSDAEGVSPTPLPPSATPAAEKQPAEPPVATAPVSDQSPVVRPKPPRPRDEIALERALEWIARHQCGDGGWSFDLGACPGCGGRCSNSGDPSTASDRTAATAVAMLPFLARGHKPADGPYRGPLTRGAAFLAALSRHGQGKAYGEGGNLVSQALAARVLAELIGAEQDPSLAAPAQLAIDYVAASQDLGGGGWNLLPTQPGSTTVTAWCVLALASAHQARRNVNPMVIKRAAGFLDSVQADQGDSYGERGPAVEARASAAGLLCRRKFGWKNENPALQSGVSRILEMGMGPDLEYCLFATCLMRDVGGDSWGLWSNRAQPWLIDLQETAGHEAGSWFDGVAGGRDGRASGRLYTTALAALVLAEGLRQ